jgi:chromosome segregation ATPase
MRGTTLRAAIVALAVMMPCAAALAQQGSTEDRLREALRRATVELRGLQDAQGPLQANLDAMTKQRDDLKQQLDEANAKLEAATAAPPAEDLQALKDQIEALKKENASLQAGVSRWQSAYQQAADVARSRDADAKKLTGDLKLSEQTVALLKDENTKLVATAQDILHLYRTQDFHAILVWSYEPVVGFKQVELQNLVQDYEDKIYNLKYVGPERPAADATKPPSTAPAPANAPAKSKPPAKAGATP